MALVLVWKFSIAVFQTSKSKTLYMQQQQGPERNWCHDKWSEPIIIKSEKSKNSWMFWNFGISWNLMELFKGLIKILKCSSNSSLCKFQPCGKCRKWSTSPNHQSRFLPNAFFELCCSREAGYWVKILNDLPTAHAIDHDVWLPTYKKLWKMMCNPNIEGYTWKWVRTIGTS